MATLLVTGATGFVGRHLVVGLQAAGHAVRCGSRDPERSRGIHPEAEHVRLDLDDPSTLDGALRGCDAAFYLVHGMGGGAGYGEREARAAEAFAEAAERASLERIVYLGGPAPQGRRSPHLESRLKTGEILRAGSVPTFELRAAMIIGAGGASWLMVRDLARRLPAMVLPRWLDNHSWPIAIDDVVAALMGALELPVERAGWYDLPGPERLSHREMLGRVARMMGQRPVMVGVPVLTPKLSSYWIALVTRADLHMAQQLVQGLRYDLDPSGTSAWEVLPAHERVPLERAVHRALEGERSGEVPSPGARARMEELGRSLRTSRAA